MTLAPVPDQSICDGRFRRKDAASGPRLYSARRELFFDKIVCRVCATSGVSRFVARHQKDDQSVEVVTASLEVGLILRFDGMLCSKV